jgi:hypothetical protein
MESLNESLKKAYANKSPTTLRASSNDKAAMNDGGLGAPDCPHCGYDPPGALRLRIERRGESAREIHEVP